ncbi:DUF6443 domain-containing protein [Sphingobacterium multivorum]|uniref:DUF6443 domain-containing protein n=1 Tax=Sphingobacterium multivorum TaxID=28454 RepID=UPI003DA6AD8E
MKKILSAIAFLLAVMVYGQDQNYVKTTVYRQPSSIPLENPTPQQAAVEINYLDGLGRPLQRRAYRQSGTGTDLVTHFAYDAFGRQAREYLPYPTQSASLAYDSAADAGIAAFYGTTPSPSTGMETTQNPYRELLFENSHLNRVLKQAAPGNAWSMGSGHEVRMAYDTNTAADGVKKYTAVTTLNSATLIHDVSLATADYEPGQLYKNITRNENWTSGLDNTVEEFTNKEGQLVLKRAYESGQRHDTYYVYDEFGNLSYVFPPLANNPAAQLDDLCYQYKYDQRNRIAEKKLPGRQWQYLVYDRLDRLVATGPAMSPFDGIAKGWLITKYDAFGRVAYTGWYQNSDSRKSVQQQVYASPNLYEIRASQTIDNISVGYSNRVFPTSGMNVLSVSWYDDYSYPGAPTTFGTVEGQTVFYNNTTEKPKGLPTGSWTRTLEGATAYRGELTTMLYDIKGRTISTKHTNYLGGHTVIDSKLDFSGKPEYTVTRNQRTNSDTEYSTREDFIYDPQDRLLSHTHKIGNLPTELLALNSYDQLGKLVSKKTGGNDLTGSTFYQKVDYSYNIRGWLKAINSIENFATDDGGTDLFAFAIRYNDLGQAYDPTLKALYNGNISETRWISRSDNRERSYSYSYDALDRLRNAAYFKDRSYTKSYDESQEYDKNGNILHMVRFGDLDYSGFIIQIDELDYTYGNGNRLKKVKDNSIHPAGFRDGADMAEEYTYDANGNMISDENKGIGTITYNHMDLPIEINFRAGSKINYLYDASGVKIRKTVLDGITSTVTDYLSGFQYINTVLDLFHTAEGYVKYVPATRLRPAQFNYVFNIKDHQGSVRMSYAMNKDKGVLAIMEESHYYPFGLKHAKYNSDQYEFVEISKEEGGYMVGIEPLGPEQRRSYQYKYQGQERQDELGLNWDSFKYRNYDFALGRFMSVDPLAEDYPYNSTYAFQENKIGLGIELEGLELFSPWLNVGLSNTPPTLTSAEVVRVGIDVGGKASETSGRFTETQLETFARGRAVEAEQLVKNGLEKNTKPYQAVDPKTGKEGTTIPDAFDGKQTVEFKNVRYQPETKQLRLQRAVSNAKGAKPRLIINQSAKVSKNVKANFDIQTYNIVPTTAKDNTDIPKPELPKPAPKKEPEVEVLDGQEIW